MTSDTLFRLRGFEDKERGQGYGLLASEWHRAANWPRSINRARRLWPPPVR